jgi:hypothetical protein
MKRHVRLPTPHLDVEDHGVEMMLRGERSGIVDVDGYLITDRGLDRFRCQEAVAATLELLARLGCQEIRYGNPVRALRIEHPGHLQPRRQRADHHFKAATSCSRTTRGAG